MGDSGRVRLIAMIGTVSGLAVFSWVVGVLQAGAVSGDAAAPSPESLFAIPVLVLLLSGAAAWFVLSKSKGTSVDTESYVQCGSCERSVLSEWRLCPYCGVRLDHGRVADDAERAPSPTP